MNIPKYNFNNLYSNIKNYNKLTDETDYGDFTNISRMLNIEANDISIKFFSKDNIEFLNNKIITDILSITRDEYNQPMRIQKQQREKMLTVMRYIYFQYVRNTHETDIEVQHLNDKFIELVIPTVLSGLISHLKYIQDYNRAKRVPLDRPITTKQKVDLKPFSSLFGF